MLKASGSGWIAISAFGGIMELTLNNEEIIVDDGYFLAYSGNINWSMGTVFGGKNTGPLSFLMSFLGGGEGLVAGKLSGTGKVWLQTRSSTARRNTRKRIGL